MPSSFSYQWETPAYKGKTEFSTGIFINGKFVDGSNNSTIEYVLFDMFSVLLLLIVTLSYLSVINPSQLIRARLP